MQQQQRLFLRGMDTVLLLLFCHPWAPTTSPAAALLPPALGQSPAQIRFLLFIFECFTVYRPFHCKRKLWLKILRHVLILISQNKGYSQMCCLIQTLFSTGSKTFSELIHIPANLGKTGERQGKVTAGTGQSWLWSPGRPWRVVDAVPSPQAAKCGLCPPVHLRISFSLLPLPLNLNVSAISSMKYLHMKFNHHNTFSVSHPFQLLCAT